MGRTYTHLNSTEREIIEQMRPHSSFGEIGRVLKRSTSTICREFHRNTGETGPYRHKPATRRAEERLKIPRKPIKLKEARLRDLVEEGIKKEWSPEQIQGSLALNEDVKISKSTIYRHIHGNEELEKHLRGTTRKRTRDKKRERIHDRVMIGQRPEIVETRSRHGDWEGDTVRSPMRSTACVATYVDRASRFLLASKLPAYRSEDLNNATLKMFEDKDLHTLTVDNGMEFGGFKDLEKGLETPIFFSRPGCPWERGSNENCNGLLRRYFAKGTDFAKVDEEELQEIVDKLNDRPRKVLGYRTPREVYTEMTGIAA